MLRGGDAQSTGVPLSGGAFQWAPTLGGECYTTTALDTRSATGTSFNGHPPLGVNATHAKRHMGADEPEPRFNGHPPLGVNATTRHVRAGHPVRLRVSMGTHPWG